MKPGTLYTYPDNFRATKALIAAQYSKITLNIPTDFVFGETNKSKTFLKKFPTGKVPALETADGLCLQDSNAIAYYCANEQLRGKTQADKALILQWIGFAESEILPAASAWVFPILGILKTDDKESLKRAQNDLKASLTILNNHLLANTYLVGERITLADIIVACNLLNPYKYAIDSQYKKPFANVNRWFNTLINQSEFKKVIGDFQFLKKEAVANAETKSSKKAESSEKKEEVVVADAKAANDEDEKPVVQDGFIMDDFKRCYSNEDEAKSIPYFWTKFDPENYSIWFSEYKYNDELTKVFMSCNLITGMFQRLDKMRKNAFASVCLFGEDNNSTISGVWVWKGQDLIFEQSPDWQIDYESYNWTKLDPKAKKTKSLVQQYFSWTGTDSKDRKFNQGKIFK